MEWLQNNYVALVVIVLIAVAFIGWLIYLCKKNGIKKIALEAILKAEEQYNTKTGQERFEYAVDFVYNKLPDFVKAILPKEIVLNIIKNIVQQTFDEVKALLDYQKPLEQGKE